MTIVRFSTLMKILFCTLPLGLIVKTIIASLLVSPVQNWALWLHCGIQVGQK